jgi:hypothetical protein
MELADNDLLDLLLLAQRAWRRHYYNSDVSEVLDAACGVCRPLSNSPA